MYARMLCLRVCPTGVSKCQRVFIATGDLRRQLAKQDKRTTEVQVICERKCYKGGLNNQKPVFIPATEFSTSSSAIPEFLKLKIYEGLVSIMLRNLKTSRKRDDQPHLNFYLSSQIIWTSSVPLLATQNLSFRPQW